MFSKRQIDILSLLRNNNEPMAAEWMAKELGVSDRTIRNEIKAIQKECLKLGMSIESIRGKGYQLQVQDKELFIVEFERLMKEQQDETTNDFSNQNDRVLYLLKHLLLEKEPIKLENFEDKMFVSKSTIQNDMKLVRELLAGYSLTLVNRPHYGTQVEGDEFMKRVCLSNYLFNSQSQMTADNGSLQILNEDLFHRIKQIIIEKVKKYKIEISDIALENLATHIAIACKRMEDGYIIEPFKESLIDEYPFEQIVAKEIIDGVQAYTNLSFPDSEVDYIIVHLLGTKLLHKEELTEFGEFDEAGDIVQCMLKRLQNELNWNFQNDHEFIQALTLHIRPAMNRLRYKMNIRNPLLEEIKLKYPTAFEGAVIASKCIEEYLSIEPGEHEIAYIALHIGVALERMKSRQREVKRVLVVCASGVGSAKLLYYRLQRLFEHELEVVGTINYYNLAEYDLSSIDFILSTIPIKENLGVPVQVVNTFLGDEDIKQIKQRMSPESQSSAALYIDRSRVFVHQELEDKESIIQFLCHELYKQGLVTEDYVNLVLQREALAPTNFGNLVAIPHPLTPVTDETFWTICTLKSPITWEGNQMVQFVCLLNIRTGPKGDLEKMYQTLITLVENKSIVQKIIRSQSVDEVIQHLNEVEKA